jgi:5-methyltetrahydrofolate--homocysteine methyltransferase
MDSLSRLIAAKQTLLADGAMGTSLFARGLETGGSPELWNVEQPAQLHAVHQGFVDAGSDILLTNSFGANRMRLALHGAAHRVAELNRAAARLAREVANGAGRPVLVAGDIGPTGEIFAPVGAFSAEDGEAAFAEQALDLAEGGVDLLWIETISSAEERAAAVAGAARAGLPIVATMTFDTRGRTMMGLTCEAAMRLRAGLAVRPVAFGANCGTGPAQLVESVLGLMRAAEPGDLIVAKGNCGLPHYHDGEIRYDGTPEIMADYACLARDAGARIIGGCCGTTPTHIAALALALATRPARPAPDLATVEQTLGPIAAEAAAPRPRTRRRDAG